MGSVFAMTLPGVVLLLLLFALVLRISRTLGSGERDHPTASPGFDVLSELFNPGDKHRLDEQRHEELNRDEVEEGAPPRSRVDLESHTAHIRVARHQSATSEATSSADRSSTSTTRSAADS